MASESGSIPFHCLDCLQRNELIEVLTIGTCKYWHLCRLCWIGRGAPFKGEHDTTICLCSEPGCRSVLSAKKGVRGKAVWCGACFERLRGQTLFGQSKNLQKGTNWFEPRTLFLGNLHCDATNEDVNHMIQTQVFPQCHHGEKLFWVRCCRGGHQGDHGAPKKIWKRFAFVEFQFARDAALMYDMFKEMGEDDDRKTFQGRSIKIHPCVIYGSWEWSYEQGWIRCVDYVRIAVECHAEEVWAILWLR